jgi:NodT family efflux transporter outer membrane factor (OMF) lipoprotein
MRYISSLTIGLALLLCGCGVGPDYKPPTVAYTRSYTKNDNLLSKEQQLVIGKKLEVAWWTLFGSKSLDKTIKQALNNNFDITVAKKHVVQAEESIKSKSGKFWPQIGVAALAGNQKYPLVFAAPAPVLPTSFSYYELGPYVAWDLDLFGSVSSSVMQQEALAKYQAYQLDAAYIVLTSNVVAQAVEIASVKAEIAAAQRIISEDKKTLHMVKTKYIIGSGTKLDVLKAKAELEQDRAMLPPLKQRLSIAKHALAILVGKAPANWITPNFTIDNFKLPKKIPLSLPSKLVHQRPDILAAEANLQGASAAIGVATANMYPKIMIDGFLFKQYLSAPVDFANSMSTIWGVLGGVVAPVFSGGTMCAEKRKTELGFEAAMAQYQQVVLEAFGQVADSLAALSNDAETIVLQQETVHLADTALKLSYKSYEIGAIGLMQVQDSQRALARAELALIRAKRQQFLDTAQLFVALGGSPISRN